MYIKLSKDNENRINTELVECYSPYEEYGAYGILFEFKSGQSKVLSVKPAEARDLVLVQLDSYLGVKSFDDIFVSEDE